VAISALVLILLFWIGRAHSIQGIIDVHEHIQNLAKAEELLRAMDRVGIDRLVLLPSPIETLTLNGNSTFTDYRPNVDEVLRIAEAHPDRFVPFCTVSPQDEDALEYFRDCHQRGGKGLKLYNGHSFFYETFGTTLDSPRMMPIYAYAERNHLPVLFHVNAINYGDELRRVLDAFPDLVVNVPHFMVSSTNLSVVEDFLNTYPNLYIDVSFGHTPYMSAGLRRISRNTEGFRQFFESYQDRILFGTDMVLTDLEKKDQTYMEEVLNCYRNILERKTFSCGIVSDYYQENFEANLDAYERCKAPSGDFCQSKKEKADSFGRWYEETRVLNGLNLPNRILKKVYVENAENWLMQ
jgi:predicted TIM-barrel fold metal-dependent hydrolase